MKKPRIEDMTDKHEVLNPDGSFRCYGSKTLDKLTEEWQIQKSRQYSRDVYWDFVHTINKKFPEIDFAFIAFNMFHELMVHLKQHNGWTTEELINHVETNKGKHRE